VKRRDCPDFAPLLGLAILALGGISAWRNPPDTLIALAAAGTSRPLSCIELRVGEPSAIQPAAVPHYAIKPLPLYSAGRETPTRPALPSALNSAVATVNYAAQQAAAAVNNAPSKQAGSDARLLDFMQAYIAEVNGAVDAAAVVALLYEAGTANGVDPLLLLALARYESRFNIADVGGAGERGLLQIHPCHKRSMKRAGLDFYSEADRLTFACMMMKRSGLKPWTVRRRAMKLYEQIKGE